MNSNSQAPIVDVSGIVVHVDPLAAAPLSNILSDMPGVTVHAVNPDGKLVATLETESEARSAELFARIQALPHVQAVAMVYHQLENDPDQEI